MAKIFIGLDAVSAALTDLPREVRKDLIEIIKEETVKALKIAQNITDSRDARGANIPHYRDSFEVVNTKTGSTLVNTAPYADVVEYGAPPHTPPLEPLFEWAREKFGVTEEEAENIAVSVKRQISQNGLEPQGILGDALVQLDANIRGRIRAYKKEFGRGTAPAIIRLKRRYEGSRGESPSKTSRGSLKV